MTSSLSSRRFRSRRHELTSRLVGAAALWALAACSDPLTLTIEVTPGHETDAFSSDPAVTRVTVAALDATGGELTSATTTPGGGFDLGELPTDQLVRFEVRGSDADGDLQIRGRSLAFVIGALQAQVFPVFAQRLDTWSRPPGELPASHTDGLAVVLGERYLTLTGGKPVGDGDAATVLFYDLFSLGGVTGGTLQSVPKSMAVSADGRALILIDDEKLLWLDFDSGGNGISITAPEGLGPYSNVAGGATVESPNATFIVGATRSDEPSDRVLIVYGDGSVASARLQFPRAGAAAIWVENIGLVVAGGSADGPGVEVLEDGAFETDTLPFAVDGVAGAAAALGPAGEQIVLACGADENGAAPVRLLDLDCGGDCAAVAMLAAPDALSNCAAHKSGDHVLLTGHGAGGVALSYELDPIGDSVRSLALREERVGGRVVAAPNGTLALFGGAHPDGSPALTVEMLFPSE